MDGRGISDLSRHQAVAGEAGLAGRDGRSVRRTTDAQSSGMPSLVTALNPKSIAFFVAFVPQFIDHAAPVLPQLIVVEATFVTLATSTRSPTRWPPIGCAAGFAGRRAELDESGRAAMPVGMGAATARSGGAELRHPFTPLTRAKNRLSNCRVRGKAGTPKQGGMYA